MKVLDRDRAVSALHLRRYRVGFIFAALAVLMSGCVTVRAWSNADIHGDDVQRSIDANIVPALRTMLVGAPVQWSRCPTRMDLSFGRTEHCVIPIGRDDIAITVTGSPTRQFDVRLVGIVFDLRRIEIAAASDIAAEYGVRLAVRCGHGWVLLEEGAHLRCSLSGPPNRFADIEIRGPSRIIVHPVVGMGRGRLADALRPYLEQHKARRRTIVPGKVIAPYVTRQILLQFGGKPEWLRPFRGVQCPNKADLSGTRRMICRIRYGGQAPRWTAWLDDAEGVRLEPGEAIVPTVFARASLLKELQGRLHALGRKDLVAIDCGPDRVLTLQPGSTFRCRAYVGRREGDVVMTVRDVEGHTLDDFSAVLGG